MRAFFTTLLVCAGVTAAFIYYTDPAYHWHRVALPLRSLHSGEVWIWPGNNIDEGRARVAQIEFAAKPDLAWMGDSTVLAAGNALVRPDRSTLNLGINSSAPEDWLALWTLLKEGGKIPSGIVLFLGPFQMIEGAPPGSGYLQRFLPAQRRADPGAGEPLPKRVFNRLSYFLPRLQVLISWDALRSSLEQTARRWHGPYAEGAIAPQRDKPAERMAYEPDGSVSFPVLNSSARDAADLARAADATRIQAPTDRMDQRRWKLFTEWIEDLERHQTKLLIIVPPRHPRVSARLRASPEQAVIDKVLAKTRKLQPRYPNLSVCDAQEAAAAGCAETEFRDPLHAEPSCLKKVLRFCMAKDSFWQNFLGDRP